MRKKIEFTQSQLEQMVQMHDNGMLNREIASHFGVSLSTINRRLAEEGVESRHPRLSEDRISQAISLYNEHRQLHKVAKLMHISEGTIRQILIDNNIAIATLSETRRQRTLNEHYFDVIDSHRKAYYLGLLFADGNVSKNRYDIQISLQEKDKDIIYQFREDIGSNHKVSYIKYNQKNPNWQNQYMLSISNPNMHDALISHGMLPNKSLILEFPNDLDPEFYSSFLLGYLDGDGTIQKKEQRVSLISTESFCKTVSKIINKQLGIHCTIIYCHKNKNVSTRILQIAGRNQVKKFLDWIYSKCDIYLERKYKIYQNVYCVA